MEYLDWITKENELSEEYLQFMKYWLYKSTSNKYISSIKQQNTSKVHSTLTQVIKNIDEPISFQQFI